MDHIQDRYLAEKLRPWAVMSFRCEFCSEDDWRPAVTESLPLSHVVAEARHVLGRFMRDANERPYDNEDGFIGEGYETDEALEYILASTFADECEETILEAIADEIDRDEKLEWTPAGSDEVDRLWDGWFQFVQLVKKHRRFIFTPPSYEQTYNSQQPADRVSGFLTQLLAYTEGAADLTVTVPAGASWFRGRLVESADKFFKDGKANADQLGPVRSAKSLANRMSPAGIPMFYASADFQTAIAEIAGHGAMPEAVIGEFHNTRPLRILDLTQILDPGSPFNVDALISNALLRFLGTFVNQITQPVIPDDRVHIDYVPTQIVTEFLRWMPRERLHGIALPSSQTGRKTYVLFFNRHVVVDKDVIGLEARMTNPWFTLDAKDIAAYKLKRNITGVKINPKSEHP